MAESNDATDEAKDVLNRWGEVLSLLETNPSDLVGRLDWVTKRYLLQTAIEENDDLAVKKKIDVHTMNSRRMAIIGSWKPPGVVRSILTPEEIEAATQSPPTDTPATIRSRYLKTFGQGKVLGVNWNTITISQGFETEDIELSNPSPAPKESSTPSPHDKDSR